jgi:hypothetical protein
MQAPGRLDEIGECRTKGRGPFVIVLADLGRAGPGQGERDVSGRTPRDVHDLRVQVRQRARQTRSWTQWSAGETQNATEHVVGGIEPHHRHAATGVVPLGEHLRPPEAQFGG